MATKTKKKYTYLTKAIQMPDGTRKYFRAKTQEELDEKVLKAQNALNQYILPAIGGYRLRDITPMQIQAIMAGLSDKSNSVQSKVLINLRSIFKTAQENGLVAKSPVSN